MFTKADILARLQNGDTVDEIAAEMANALNEAEAEKKALDAELAAKEKEETRVLDAKRVAVDMMLDALCDYYVAAGYEEYTKDIAEIDTDKVIKLLDNSIEMAKSLEKLKDLEFTMFGPGLTKPKAKVTDMGDADKVIGDWLKSFGL
jgi:hypothetical protein